MTPRRVTITGGAGFFGEHAARRFRSTGWDVRVLDTAEPPRWSSELDVEFHSGDVRDGRAVDGAIVGATCVVHAAFAPPSTGLTTMHGVNVVGTRNVRDAARRAAVEHLVLISSTAVERPLRPHPVLRGSPLTRLHAYGASRAAAEAELRDGVVDGPAIAVVRPKTFLGPGRVGGFALVFGLVRDGRSVPLLGPGTIRYQLLDVRDLADAVHRAAEATAAGLFRLGAGEVGPLRDELRALVDHAGTGSRIRSVPGRVGRVALRSLELAALPPLAEWHHCVARGVDSVVDTSRAREALGWHPTRTNVEVLVDAYDWFAGQRAGEARTTHPVPTSHRWLRRAAGAVLR